MQRHTSRVSICSSLMVLGLTNAGCGDRVNPAGPSMLSGAGTAVLTAGRAPEPTIAAFRPASERDNPSAQALAGRVSPTDLTNRGWTCFQPLPDRIVCSHQNQGFPTVAIPPAQPPEDRPATFTFFAFDGTGGFVGPELLIRTDLYNGQLCESTGQPFDFVPVIGYYECVHAAGR